MHKYETEKEALNLNKLGANDAWSFLTLTETSEEEVLAMIKSKVEDVVKNQKPVEELDKIWNHEYNWLMKSLARERLNKSPASNELTVMHSPETDIDQRFRSMSELTQTPSVKSAPAHDWAPYRAVSGRSSRQFSHVSGSMATVIHRRRRYHHHRATRRPLGFHDLKSISEAGSVDPAEQELALFLLDNYFSDSDEDDAFEAQKVYVLSVSTVDTSFDSPSTQSAGQLLPSTLFSPLSSPARSSFARRPLYRASYAYLDDRLKDRVSRRIVQRRETIESQKSTTSALTELRSIGTVHIAFNENDDNDSDSDLISELSVSKGVSVVGGNHSITNPLSQRPIGGDTKKMSLSPNATATATTTTTELDTDMTGLATIHKWNSPHTVLLRGGSVTLNYSTTSSSQKVGATPLMVIMQPVESTESSEVENWNKVLTPYAQMSEAMSKYHSKLNQWTFDAFEFMNDPATQGLGLPLIAFHIMKTTGLLELCEVEADKFWNFSEQVQKGYLDNPYHNKYHACDVLSHMTIWDEFGAYVAAMVHDLGHDGYNNAFHLATASNLALLYGDASLLENYHISETFRILSQSNCNWMQSHSLSVRRYLGILIKQIVLGTDMKHHGTNMANFNELVKILRYQKKYIYICIYIFMYIYIFFCFCK
ncbi:hypothetical protein RFI_06911 [Reticulomyxa filosa]|uniref:Phosphodiesterase n=1 Tax=Reticulomyxa filosa TaxID=46433 RepID=X6NY38_RETFI|nr:hypothetical protein RFI_06911 [Reticulomyxa filosa]|eukprot:ETO30207.1 hypothetical protein RFI_06911 [Reticulomyxa filosa]